MNIKRMAEIAGMTRRPADWQCRAPYWDVVIDPELEHFADLVLEEAAKVCDELAELSRTSPTDSMWQHGECAAAIRALKGAKE